MSKNTNFDYREFIQKGFDTLDDGFLDEHFGSSEAATPSSHKVGTQSIHREYAIVKTLAKHGVKPNCHSTFMMINGSSFSQHVVKDLTPTQQEGLKSGRGCVEVRLLDDNTGKIYDTKLVVHGKLYYLNEIEKLINDRQLKENQQVGLYANDGILHFTCT